MNASPAGQPREHPCMHVHTHTRTRTQALGNCQTHYSHMGARSVDMNLAHAETRRAFPLPTSSNSFLADIIWTAPSTLLQGSKSRGK